MKKRNNTKNTNKLPMPGKVKKGFRFYVMTVLALTFVMGMSVTAFAANNDPLTVVNNLSDFIFGLIRAVGLKTDAEILEYFGDDPTIRATLEKDTCKTYEEALLEIYRKLRPG